MIKSAFRGTKKEDPDDDVLLTLCDTVRIG